MMLSILIGVATVAASDNTNVITIGNGQCIRGSMVSLPLDVGGEVDLCAFELRITFDAAVLAYARTDNLNSNAMINYVDETNEILINYSSTVNVNGNIHIGNIVFKANAVSESSAVTVEITSIAKLNSSSHIPEPIDSTTHNATVSVDESDAYVLGDVNGDTAITIADVTLIYQHVRGKIALTGDALLAADVNGIGGVTIADVTLVYQYVRGKISSF
jgi:hypothetical protein